MYPSVLIVLGGTILLEAGARHPRRPRGSQSSREKRRDDLCLKTFVAPFLLARLTAPGSPRMGVRQFDRGGREGPSFNVSVIQAN